MRLKLEGEDGVADRLANYLSDVQTIFQVSQDR